MAGSGGNCAPAHIGVFSASSSSPASERTSSRCKRTRSWAPSRSLPIIPYNRVSRRWMAGTICWLWKVEPIFGYTRSLLEARLDPRHRTKQVTPAQGAIAYCTWQYSPQRAEWLQHHRGPRSVVMQSGWRGTFQQHNLSPMCGHLVSRGPGRYRADRFTRGSGVSSSPAPASQRLPVPFVSVIEDR